MKCFIGWVTQVSLFGAVLASGVALANPGAWTLQLQVTLGAERLLVVGHGGTSRSVLAEHASGGEYAASISEADEDEPLHLDSTDYGTESELEIERGGEVAIFLEVDPQGHVVDCSLSPELLAGVEHLVSAIAYDRYLEAPGTETLAIRNAVLYVLDQEACP